MADLLRLRLIIPGTPAGSGSKSAFPLTRGPKGPLVFRKPPTIRAGEVWGTPAINVTDSSKASAPFRRLVERIANQAYRAPPIATPVTVTICYWFERPASHIGTGRNKGTLKASAPVVCTRGHDSDKLDRSVRDGMEGVVYVDDRQVVGSAWSCKRWINPDTFADGRDWTAEEDFTAVVVQEIDQPPPLPACLEGLFPQRF